MAWKKGPAMNRQLAESIARIGFRKWYERQLLSSHAHFVLGFLSAIGLLASVEAFRGTYADPMMLTLFVLLCGAIGAWALRQYSFLLMRAEQAASQASCPECGEYGRFAVLQPRHADADIGVRCHKCSCEWVITATA